MGGALAYVAIYFCLWWGLEIEGKLIRDQVGFIDFLRIFLVNQKIQVGRGAGPVVELGNWGYARFGINLVGFALGVVTMVAIAGGKTYCPKCRRYFKTVGTQVRTSIDPQTTAYQLHPVIAGLASGRVQEAVDLHAASGVPGTKGYWTSTVVVEGCPGCGRHHATLTATVPGDKGVDHVEGFRFLGTTDRAVQISA